MELELKRPWSGSVDLAIAVEQIQVQTHRRVEFVDLTDAVARPVAARGIRWGLVHVQSRHTTTGIVLNENEPGLIQDLQRSLERWAPRGAGYRHDDLAARPGVPPDERPNGDAHARAVLLGSTLCLGVVAGELQLGRWQRLFLVELDGPRQRSVALHMLGCAGEPAWPRSKHGAAGLR